MVKAADIMIARRADTRARADFATWKMMAKLNGFSALPPEAQNFLAGYKALLANMPEAEATEATINTMYKAYFVEMGGIGTPPDVRSRPSQPATGNVTAFKRPPPARPTPTGNTANTKPRLPVALIFACLILVYVGIRYYWR